MAQKVVDRAAYLFGIAVLVSPPGPRRGDGKASGELPIDHGLSSAATSHMSRRLDRRAFSHQDAGMAGWYLVDP